MENNLTTFLQFVSNNESEKLLISNFQKRIQDSINDPAKQTKIIDDIKEKLNDTKNSNLLDAYLNYLILKLSEQNSLNKTLYEECAITILSLTISNNSETATQLGIYAKYILLRESILTSSQNLTMLYRDLHELNIIYGQKEQLEDFINNVNNNSLANYNPNIQYLAKLITSLNSIEQINLKSQPTQHILLALFKKPQTNTFKPDSSLKYQDDLQDFHQKFAGYWDSLMIFGKKSLANNLKEAPTSENNPKLLSRYIGFANLHLEFISNLKNKYNQALPKKLDATDLKGIANINSAFAELYNKFPITSGEIKSQPLLLQLKIDFLANYIGFLQIINQFESEKSNLKQNCDLAEKLLKDLEGLKKEHLDDNTKVYHETILKRFKFHPEIDLETTLVDKKYKQSYEELLTQLNKIILTNSFTLDNFTIIFKQLDKLRRQANNKYSNLYCDYLIISFYDYFTCQSTRANLAENITSKYTNLFTNAAQNRNEALLVLCIALKLFTYAQGLDKAKFLRELTSCFLNNAAPIEQKDPFNGAKGHTDKLRFMTNKNFKIRHPLLKEICTIVNANNKSEQHTQLGENIIYFQSDLLLPEEIQAIYEFYQFTKSNSSATGISAKLQGYIENSKNDYFKAYLTYLYYEYRTKDPHFKEHLTISKKISTYLITPSLDWPHVAELSQHIYRIIKKHDILVNPELLEGFNKKLRTVQEIENEQTIETSENTPKEIENTQADNKEIISQLLQEEDQKKRVQAKKKEVEQKKQKELKQQKLQEKADEIEKRRLQVENELKQREEKRQQEQQKEAETKAKLLAERMESEKNLDKAAEKSLETLLENRKIIPDNKDLSQTEPQEERKSNILNKELKTEETNTSPSSSKPVLPSDNTRGWERTETKTKVIPAVGTLPKKDSQEAKKSLSTGNISNQKTKTETQKQADTASPSNSNPVQPSENKGKSLKKTTEVTAKDISKTQAEKKQKVPTQILKRTAEPAQNKPNDTTSSDLQSLVSIDTPSGLAALSQADGECVKNNFLYFAEIFQHDTLTIVKMPEKILHCHLFTLSARTDALVENFEAAQNCLLSITDQEIEKNYNFSDPMQKNLFIESQLLLAKIYNARAVIKQEFIANNRHSESDIKSVHELYKLTFKTIQKIPDDMKEFMPIKSFIDSVQFQAMRFGYIYFSDTTTNLNQNWTNNVSNSQEQSLHPYRS